MKNILALLLTFVATFNSFAQTADSTDTALSEEYSDSIVCADTTAVEPFLPWPQNIEARLERVIETSAALNTSNIGVMIYDLTADSIIFRYNERKTMRPASTMKLITAIAAIDRLGGSYLFHTSLKYTGNVCDNVLNGDIYCVGGFDPRFNSDDMRAFVEGIRSLGVDTIRGSLIADKMMKDDDRLGWGWCWDDDNPTLSPLLISRKDNFMERFTSELANVGIVITGDIIEGDTPSDAYELVNRTHSIDQILMRMMKDSDNLYAEAMFYQLAASHGNRPATAQDARNIIKRLVKKIGLNPADYIFADGSGLSLYNYVSAELEVAMLRYAYRNSNIYLHLSPSLPIAGTDGSLKRRMKSAFTADNVKAKTGTVKAVQALAGYCTAANSHELCFAIINNGILKGSTARTIQDKICQELCRP